MRHQRWTISGSVFLLTLMVLLALIGAAPVWAQHPASIGQKTLDAPTETPRWEALSVDERRDLLSRLSDEQVREIMTGQLDRAAKTTKPDARESSMISGFQLRTHLVRENLGRLLGEVENIPSAFTFANSKLTEGRSPWQVLIVIAGMALMFAVGSLGEWLFRRWTRPARLRFEQASPQRLSGKLGYLGLRLVLDFAALAIFAGMAMGTFFVIYQGHEPSRNLVMTYISAILIIRLVSLVSRFLFAPAAPHVRMIPFDDATAHYYHRCIVWFAGITSFGLLTCALLQILGLSEDLHLLLRMMVGTVATVMLCLIIWHGRHGVAQLIRADAASGKVENQLMKVMAETWHLLAIAYVVTVVALSFVRRLSGEDTNTGVAIGSLLIVVAVPLLDAAIGRLLNDFALRRHGTDMDANPAAGYGFAIRRAARIILVLLGIVAFARLWGFDLFSMADQSLGAAVTRTLLDVGFTILIAYVAWQIARTAIDKHLASDGDAAAVERGAEGGGTGASRVRTLLPLLRRFLQITIAVIVIMIVLSSLGVDIGPLIAGAGVIGLAIGFGAQTLVRDIVSGIFFLLDDAFRVGEYVDIGAVKGIVEKITVRSLILRHHMGPLHTVPFGEIKYLSNYSRDWVIMKLEFRVTYDTDMNKVKKIFKTIGAELLEDEILGPGFIEPFKSQGVKAMEDSAIIIRGKFMAKPGQQFMIRKEIYGRVQQAFKEAGIEFAHRRVLVDLPHEIDPNSEDAKKIREAAAAAVAEQEKSPA